MQCLRAKTEIRTEYGRFKRQRFFSDPKLVSLTTPVTSCLYFVVKTCETEGTLDVSSCVTSAQASLWTFWAVSLVITGFDFLEPHARQFHSFECLRHIILLVP